MDSTAQRETPLILSATLSATSTGYTNVSVPQDAGAIYYSINYYDHYPTALMPANYSAPTGSSIQTRGLLTASKVAVLNTPTDYLWSVHYYDDLGRGIKTYAQHYLGGHSAISTNNYDAVTSAYNFTNAVTQTTRVQYTKASTTVPAVTISNTYNYDHLGRKKSTGEQIYPGSSLPPTSIYLSYQEYNELGQLKAKHYNSTDGVNYLGETTYSYNERGWITAMTPINGITGYNETLNYDQPSGTGAIAQYNGNISQFSYNSPHMEAYRTQPTTNLNTVNYTYDALNRLLTSPSSLGISDETVAYDPEGNISSLARTSGPSPTATATTTYAYAYSPGTNQLAAVTANSAAFRSYTYDNNGNATSDGGLGTAAKSITYNMLNLPQFITQNGVKIDTFTYDANGQKLRNQSASNGRWDYINGIVYNEQNSNHTSAIAFIQTEEGRATIPLNGTVFSYTYDLKDYLGNVRASFDNGGTGGTTRVVQEDNYCPFGLDQEFYQFSNQNRYLYNGKELQLDLTSQYDYGARFYDPVIGRWTTIDPLAEISRRWSHYNYGEDNPIKNVDPDGMEVFLGQGQYGGDLYTGADAANVVEDAKKKPSDWVMNNKTHEVHNDPKVQSASQAGNDQTYIGPTGNYTSTNGYSVQLNANGSWNYKMSNPIAYNRTWGAFLDGIKGSSTELNVASGIASFAVGAGIPAAEGEGILTRMFSKMVDGGGEAIDEVGTQYSEDLENEAKGLYPNKAGRIELHHIIPKYLGGAVDGELAPIDAAYHQVITNAFRNEWPYGIGKPSANQLQEILNNVYNKLPLP